MKPKNTYTFEDLEREHSQIQIYYTLDDSIEYVSTGEHSAEKYLARLEARKKAQAEKSDS